MSESIERITSALQFIDVGGHDERVPVAMMIKSELGDAGREVWDVWRDGRGDDEAASVWRSIDPDGPLTIATLFHKAKANGWPDDGHYRKPTAEELAERDRLSLERAKQVQAEQEATKAKTANIAATIWKAATPAKEDLPYLARKQVQPVATLREIEAGTLPQLLGYAPKSNGEPLVGRVLVVPVKQAGSISTLELIDGNGRKAALAGAGTKAGGFWASGPLPDDNGKGLVLVIGEGVATALSAHEATGRPAFAALSSGNLSKVAKAMRERYPLAELVILADLVKVTGEPDPHAIEAAQAVGGKLAVPVFGPDREPGQTDFNDMAQGFGSELVAEAIRNAKAPAPNESNWPEPQPLTAKVEPEPYPLDALPLPIRAAVEEVAGFVKAPVPMVASSALAALSLAIQAHADAKRAEKLHGPVGLFLLTIADSGERKSTCDGFFTRAIRDYEEAKAEAAKPVLKDHRAAIEAWEAKRGGVKEKIRQLAKDNKPTAGMESSLRDLEHDKPEPPRIPRLLYADATPEALAYGLAKEWPSGGVVSAEAGIVFGSHGMGKDSVMRNLGLLNQLWDGTSLTIDRRKEGGSFTVRGARLTVALQVQEPTLREFFTRSGALARGTGFLARFLVAWPESTIGHRPFTEAPEHWPHLDAFHRRITEILNLPAPVDDDGALTPILLTMTPEAKTAWMNYHDAIESELSIGGELYDVKDVAAKSADNAARLATLFQMFEGAGGAIGADAFEGASRITAWHLSEARRFFGELALPAELADAARLDGWLIGHCRQARMCMVGKNYVRQHGPLRDGGRLDNAIRELAELDRLRLEKDGKRLTIHLNPALVGVTA